MGGKTSQSSQQVQIPPEVLARYNSVNATAEQAASTPFQEYGGQFVAPVNAQQQMGQFQTASAADQAQPYFGAATSQLLNAQGQATPMIYGASQGTQQALQQGTAANQRAAGLYGAGLQLGAPAIAGSGAAVDPSQIDSNAINQYMNPFLNSVVGQTMALQNQQNQQAMAGQTGNAIQQGAFGGDRAGIAAANLQGQQNLATGNLLSGLLSQGYGQALSTAQQQQGVNLAAQQANLARQGQAGQALAGLFGNTAQGLAGLGQQQYAQGTGSAAQQAAIANQLYGMGAGTSQALAGLGTGAQGAALQGAQANLAAGQLSQQTQQALDTATYNQFLQQQSYPFQTAQFLANIAEGTGALSGSTTTTTQPGSMLARGGVAKNYASGGAASSEGGVVGPQHMYEGFAYGGGPALPGISQTDMGALLSAQSQMFGPFGEQGRNIGGLPGSSSGRVPAANLPVSHLAVAGPLQKQQSQLEQLKQLSDLSDDANKGVQFIKRQNISGDKSSPQDHSKDITESPPPTGSGSTSPGPGLAPASNVIPQSSGDDEAELAQGQDPVYGPNGLPINNARGGVVGSYYRADGGLVGEEYDNQDAPMLKEDTSSKPEISHNKIDIPTTGSGSSPKLVVAGGASAKDPTMDDVSKAASAAASIASIAAMMNRGGVAGDRNNYAGGGLPYSKQADGPGLDIPDDPANAKSLATAGPLPSGGSGGLLGDIKGIAGLGSSLAGLGSSLGLFGGAAGAAGAGGGIAAALPFLAALSTGGVAGGRHGYQTDGTVIPDPEADTTGEIVAAPIDPVEKKVLPPDTYTSKSPQERALIDRSIEEQMNKDSAAFAASKPIDTAPVERALEVAKTATSNEQMAPPPVLQASAIAPSAMPGVAPAVEASAPQQLDDIDRIVNAIGHVETGNRNIIGPETVNKDGTRDRPYGFYQVMGKNIPSWTNEVIGKTMTPEQFMADEEAQKRVAAAKLGQSYTKTGSADDTASIWFSGKPASAAGNVQDVLGTSVPGYLKKFRDAYGSAPSHKDVRDAGGKTHPEDTGAAGGTAPKQDGDAAMLAPKTLGDVAHPKTDASSLTGVVAPDMVDRAIDYLAPKGGSLDYAVGKVAPKGGYLDRLFSGDADTIIPFLTGVAGAYSAQTRNPFAAIATGLATGASASQKMRDYELQNTRVQTERAQVGAQIGYTGAQTQATQATAQQTAIANKSRWLELYSQMKGRGFTHAANLDDFIREQTGGGGSDAGRSDSGSSGGDSGGGGSPQADSGSESIYNTKYANEHKIGNIPAANLPSYLVGYQNYWAGMGGGPNSYAGQQASWAAERLRSLGGEHAIQTFDADGNVVPIPSAYDAARSRAQLVGQNNRAIAFQDNAATWNQTRYGQLTDQNRTLIDQYKNYAGGQFAPQMANIDRTIQFLDPDGSMGLRNIMASTFGKDWSKDTNASNYDIANKIIANQIAQSVDGGGMSGAPASSISLLQKAVAAPGLNASARRTLLVHLQALVAHDNALYNEYGTTGENIDDYSKNFNTRHPYQQFVEDAEANTPVFKGMVLVDPKARRFTEEGQRIADAKRAIAARPKAQGGQ